MEEARFVDPKAYGDYYLAFVQAYAEQLEQALQKGKVSAGDAEVRAWVLMGIAKTLGERFVLWEEKVDIERVPVELARIGLVQAAEERAPALLSAVDTGTALATKAMFWNDARLATVRAGLTAEAESFRQLIGRQETLTRMQKFPQPTG